MTAINAYSVRPAMPAASRRIRIRREVEREAKAHQRVTPMDRGVHCIHFAIVKAAGGAAAPPRDRSNEQERQPIPR